MTLRLGEHLSLRLAPRVLWVSVALVVGVLVAAAVALTSGELGLTWAELLALPSGAPDGAAGFKLERVTGPRLVTGILAGMALGVAGSLFQTVTRNPLGSPEIVGLTTGASAGAALSVLFPGVVPMPLAAVLGGATAVTLVWIGTGTGFAAPGRLIIVGIAVGAIASAVTGLALSRVGDEQAQTLAFFLSGSLASRAWTDVLTIGLAVLVLFPLALSQSRRLDLVAVGDELADALGGRIAATRTWSIVIAVLLAGAAVSVAGPIAFVSLVAPQIAVRLTGGHFPGIIAPALMGALLLTLSDLAVQLIDFGAALPVGIFTAAIGSAYLGFLLVREVRKGVL